jgi:hypothetical protein
VQQVTVAPEAGADLAPPPLTATQLALHAGWTMAVLYGKIPAPPAGLAELPTTHELQPPDRRELELKRLGYLLQELAYRPGMERAGLPTEVPASNADETALSGTLPTFNLAILDALAVTPPEVQLAYELGRSLRDTVNPPSQYATGSSAAPALARQFARDRISALQERLGTLSTQLPQHAAAIVAASLGRWSELAAVTVSTETAQLKKKGDGEAVAAAMIQYLLRQGDLWLLLLTGGRPAAGLLSPEGYVAAAEMALHRSGAIVRQVLRRYAIALLIVAAALGGIIYLAVNNLGGAAKVWTAIAATGGSLGLSARTITSTTTRLTAEAERPVFAMAEEDAIAWAITTMPPVRLKSRGVRQLRRAGIAPTRSLGRI